jgi:hypothetical protein
LLEARQIDGAYGAANGGAARIPTWRHSLAAVRSLSHHIELQGHTASRSGPVSGSSQHATPDFRDHSMLVQP